MDNIFLIAFIYLLFINIISVVLTVKDKRNAIKKKKRVKENTLMLLSLMGGGIVMYLTMVSIHHKTKHRKFMIGIPFIVILEVVFIVITMYSVGFYG